MNLDKENIAVIGLGYVGLPLAVAFGALRRVVGFDTRRERIEDLSRGFDSTFEIDAEGLKSAGGLTLTADPALLGDCGIFIVTVPTPIDLSNRPDLAALRQASEIVGGAMSDGAMVIYESTVYPGCTRNVCVPILEEVSGLAFNEGFFVGYSPERANPGDREHRLATVM
jgi:UDP-N-acetyl-D-galactosamine dehydrogenase